MIQQSKLLHRQSNEPPKTSVAAKAKSLVSSLTSAATSAFSPPTATPVQRQIVFRPNLLHDQLISPVRILSATPDAATPRFPVLASPLVSSAVHHTYLDEAAGTALPRSTSSSPAVDVSDDELRDIGTRVISLPVRDNTEQTFAWQDVDFQWLDDRQFNRDRHLTVDTDQNVTVDPDQTSVKQIDDGLFFGDKQRLAYNPFVFAPVLEARTETGRGVPVDTVRVRRQDFVAGGLTAGTSFNSGWLGADNFNNNASSDTDSDSDSDSDDQHVRLSTSPRLLSWSCR